MAVKVLCVTVHLVFPEPPHPTSYAEGVGGAFTFALRFEIG